MGTCAHGPVAPGSFAPPCQCPGCGAWPAVAGGKRVGPVDWYADCCDEKPSAEQQSQSGTDVACVINFLYRRCNPDTPSCNAGLAQRTGGQRLARGRSGRRAGGWVAAGADGFQRGGGGGGTKASRARAFSFNSACSRGCRRPRLSCTAARTVSTITWVLRSISMFRRSPTRLSANTVARRV